MSRPESALTLLTGVLIMLSGPARGQEIPATADRWNRAALHWIGLLEAGDFETAAARVDPAVPANALGEARLTGIWAQLAQQLGALRSIERGSVTEQGPYHVVDLPATFESAAVTVRVVLTEDLLVSGFFVRPPEPSVYEAPGYVDVDSFREDDVTIGQPPWELPGVLTLPSGGGPFPVVVLVHGSGPNDRDETVAGNRPFRDLAWGLASRGIAVLRYDKRTRVYGAKMTADIGLDEEVVEDAVQAVEMARSHPAADAAGIFLLGHSLGGIMAPAIARRSGKVAGVIVMAGPVRPFDQVLVAQLEYVASLESEPDSPARTRLDSLVTEARRWSAGELDASDTLLGVPVAYWKELEAVDPVGAARSLSVPFLILQGGRDYQSTAEDLELWRRGLEGRAGTTFRLYPDLNHLFAPGEGTATPAEYGTEVKHVDEGVIEDVARWVLEDGGR